MLLLLSVHKYWNTLLIWSLGQVDSLLFLLFCHAFARQWQVKSESLLHCHLVPENIAL